jgi:hypothetical protein
VESKENAVTLNLVQAMLGSVTPNWRAVFLKDVGDHVLVTVLFEQESSEDREEAQDLAFELAALQPQSAILIEVRVNALPMENFADLGRMVFARKE